MLRIATGAALGGLAALAIGASPAGAGENSFPTTVLDMQASCAIDAPGFEDLCYYTGLIGSPRVSCIPNRKVKIFALVDPGAQPQLVDTARTSRRGGFTGIGRPSDVSAFKVTVMRKRIRAHSRTITCRAASLAGA